MHSKINKLLRTEVTNATSMINGLSKHKLFASNYAEATAIPDSSDEQDEIQLKPKPRAKKNFKSAPTEPVIVPKVPAKKPRGTIRDALLHAK